MQYKETGSGDAAGCCSGGCACGHIQEAGAWESPEETRPGNVPYIQSVWQIEGLDCGDCAEKLRKRIAALPGVKHAKINFGLGKLYVTHRTPAAEILQCIEQAGYKIAATGRIPRRHAWLRTPKTVATGLAGVLLMVAAVADLFAEFQLAAIVLYAMSVIFGGYYVVRSAWSSVRSLSPDMNLLMTIAVVGAIVLGQWSEAAMVVFLFAVGNTLQTYTLEKTRRAIGSLLSLAPRQAVVKYGDAEKLVSVEDICPGAIVIVKPGERIPMDGEVMKGISSVDQAAITGESMPVEKTAGAPVYAGTINQEGSLEIRVTKLVKDSTLAKIMHLVEEAQAKKVPAQQFIEIFAAYYTPVVIFGAMALAIVPWLFFGQPFSPWFHRALILLVISCPCALVISTPVSVVAAIGSASRHGVLIKGGAHLDAIGKIKSLAFDKTGTLTYGRPTVTNIICFHPVTEAELLAVAASLEKRSEHPVARAIVAKAGTLSLKEVENFHALAGKGAWGTLDGQTYYIGNRRLFQELGIDLTSHERVMDNLAQGGKTLVLAGTAEILLGIIAVADTVKESGPLALEILRQRGIEAIVMLTGDSRQAADSVAEKFGIQEIYSELLPEDKVSLIHQLRRRYGSVAMVGDGVNDAPALAAANVGIAMGAVGTDSALETADIALMTEDLGKLSYVINLGRNTLKIIKQNILFALVLKFAFILLTLGGLSNLWMAVFADTGAAVLVTLNGMRLARK